MTSCAHDEEPGGDRVGCPMTPSLGAYVLGAVDDAERALIDAHLEACAECRVTFERLMPLPGFLAVVSGQEVARRARRSR